MANHPGNLAIADPSSSVSVTNSRLQSPDQHSATNGHGPSSSSRNGAGPSLSPSGPYSIARNNYDKSLPQTPITPGASSYNSNSHMAVAAAAQSSTSFLPSQSPVTRPPRTAPHPQPAAASISSGTITQHQPGAPSVQSNPSSRSTQPQSSVRIYRQDGKYHIINCPPTTTVASMRSALTKKLGIKGETHRLYMREKGRQRVLNNSQKPAQLLHRRLEQAGYTPSDDYDTLGGEDMGFLVRFIFKNASLGVVEVRIDDESFSNGFEHVELADRALETVPIVLHRNASQIITLNLSKNPLVDIPHDFVADADSLRELRLTNCALKKIPRSVRQIKSLQWLDISCNRIAELDHAGLDQIPGLRQIFVQNNQLTNLPRNFASMLSLKFLNISNNKFDRLPPVICEMPNLVDLDASFNSISVLPADIGRLVALERFIIVGNQIREFPAEMRLMISLQELDCRRNLISDLSPLSALEKLDSLLAEHNTINVLDFVVSPRLVTLNTSHNRTGRSLLRPHLPASPVQLAAAPPNLRFKLTTLDLSHMKLSSFGEEEDITSLRAFSSLITLRLDYNEFRAIPDVICDLADLETLSCTNNDLHNLPKGIGKLKKLRVFNVHNNNIKVVPESIWECESLVELNMSSNSLEGWEDPAINPNEPFGLGLGGPLAAASTATLMLGSASNGYAIDDASTIHYDIERKGSAAGLSITGRTIPPLAFSLQRLFLADNYLGVTNRTTSFDIFHTLSYMRELRVLNLSFNQLNELPSSHLHSFSQLYELYLSGNNLTSLPGDMIKSLKLKVLHLNGNKLQTLPAELGKVSALETLDVGNNLLKYNVTNWQYDWNWNFNSQLKYLNLSGNKRLEIKNMQMSNAPVLDPSSATAQDRLFDFADLTKLRVLGLMDVTLRGASVPDDSLERRVRTSDTEINHMAYGIADTLGNVDGPMTFDLALQRFRGKENECLFGMFGRTQPNLNSNRAARYLHENFAQTFQDALVKSAEKFGGEDVLDALRSAFLGLNRSLYEHLATKEYENPGAGMGRKLSTVSMSGPIMNDLKGGASAIVLHIIDQPEGKKTMYVANVGDMLAVVSQSSGSFVAVSVKHDPFERSEIVRIRGAEGWVSPKGMVNEEEDLSRNFGFFHLLPAVNARPDVMAHTLTEADEFVIIANRGIWDYMSYRTAVDTARQNRDDPMKAAQMLRDHAMSYGADGNTVVMVIAVSDLFTGGSRARNLQDDMYVPTRRTGPRPERDRLLRILPPSVDAPTGHLALVFTDIRNSTVLWEKKNAGMSVAMKEHNELLRRQARWIGGFEVKTEGDSFMMAFQTLPAAVLWCFKVQMELLHLDWPMEILESEDGAEIQDSEGTVIARGLSVRMGIHWGKPVCAEDPTTHRMDYFGPMVNRSARIMAQAQGGQIMVSSDVVRELEIIKEAKFDDTHVSFNHIEALKQMGIELISMGERSLKGLEAPEALSLAFPSMLLGRLQNSFLPPSAAAPSRTQFSLDQVMELNLLAVRLEALASSRIFKPDPPRRSIAPVEMSEGVSPGALGASNSSEPNAALFWHADREVLLPKFKADSSDEDILLMLDHIVGRIENALSSIQIRTMMQPAATRGGLPPRLEDIDPHMLLQAIRIVQGLMSPIARVR
ncbi:PP2C-domain-containing protein [Clavulina sp. PMI_390]|nr:PP2C-domain-containing protein [Clavulina sp. PMI_390]